MSSPRDAEARESNRLSWNVATRAHNRHKKGQAEFLRKGGSTLFPEEVELLGDLEGKSLLHLLCNSGQDTLSLARRGARVTGVDLSDEAIATARRLSRESGIPGDFHRADAFEYLATARSRGDRYDRVFLSYGALCWLSDLDLLARGIHALLRPGGLLVIVEFHPVACSLGEGWVPEFDALGGGRLETPEGVGDYVADSDGGLLAGEPAPSPQGEDLRGFSNPHPSFEFAWGVGDVVTAVLGAGLTLRSLTEYPYVNGWKILPDLEETPERRMVPPSGRPLLPFMYSLTAEKSS